MQGFDPLSLDFLRLAHDAGLGCADAREMEIVGEDIDRISFGFRTKDTFASRGQKAIYHGHLKPFERVLLRTNLVPWSYLASRVYHDLFWYRTIGRMRVRKMMRTEWGKLFQEYA
jgi:hypothetical protein